MNSYRPGENIFKGRHSFVFGATQQGKTHFMRSRIEDVKEPVLFFNPQNEDVPGIKVGPGDDLRVILAALKKGRRLNFIPSLDNKRAAIQLGILVDGLFRDEWTKERPMIFVFDECHLANEHPEGIRAVELVATRGLRFGIHCVFATQRPAYANKAAFTQSDLHVMFRTAMERQYMTAKGIDMNAYERIIKEGGKYSYAVFDGLELQGPFKE